MIGRLSGQLVAKQPPWIVIDVHGVGYELETSMNTLVALPAINESVSLFTHLTIRDDAHLLYGFGREHERALFRALIKVNGVGPKLAARIVNELKDKAGALPGVAAGVGAAALPTGGASADAVSALENLGFKPAVAARAVASAQGELGESASEGELIRVALKKAAG